MKRYTIFQKNKKYRKNPKWYLRVREGTVYRDIPLDTTDRTIAEQELMRVKLADSEMTTRGIEGNPLDALAIARKGGQEPFTAPGGTLDRWEAWMRVQGLREGSILKYTKAARVLLKGKVVELMTPGDVASVIAGTVNLKNNTRHSYCNALANLFRYMKRPDLGEALPKIKVEQVDRNWWNRFEMQEIVMSVKSDMAERTEQYRQYFGIMAAVGSRQGETYYLKWRDLDSEGCITFRPETTKSGKGRRVPLPVRLVAELEARRGNPDEPIFPDIGRDQGTRFNVLKRCLKKLGLKGNMHTFRHSVSMLMYKKSNDIKACSDLLGHSPQVAMQYYQNARSIETLRELVED